MGDWLREVFASMQYDPDERQAEFRKRVALTKKGAEKVVARRQLPNKYWGFWQDKPLTQTYDNKSQYLNLTNYDRMLKTMQKLDPSLKEIADPTFASCKFETERIAL